MPIRPVVNDALWTCLCPSFRPTATSRTITARQIRPRPTACARLARRTLYTPSTDPFTGFDPNPVRNAFKKQSRSREDATPLVHLPTPDLYERLRRDGAAGRHEDVMSIIKILIKDRRERLNTRLYSAMLHSFVSPVEGTVGKMRKVLEEMDEVGVELDAGACHALLDALAVHPDYLLREEVLTYMKERWFTLSDQGHNMVVAGLLRERLFEQAVQKIEEMQQQNILVQDWLLDSAIWFLLDYSEVDEAWQLLQIRQRGARSSISHALYRRCLDVAAKLHHSEAIHHLWDTRVAPSYLRPPTSTCLNVLAFAARSGDVKLATDVFRVLSARGTVLTSHHYEPLLEAYLNGSDLNAALSIIIIMNESAIKVDEGSVHTLYTFLKEDESSPLQAFQLLQNFEASGRKVPTAAVNACIQASIHHNQLAAAIDIYKALHSVSKAGPNTQTFNILFQGCHKASRKELAMFLAAEMMKLDIDPDAMTYDRLVLVCCNADDTTDAFLYYEEMKGLGFVGRRGMFELLIEKGIAARNKSTPDVLRDMRKAGFVPKRETEIKVREIFGEAPSSEEGLRAFAGGI